MKVKYNKKLKIAGIGLAPWPRIGPEKWFNNYKIFTYFNWDLSSASPEVFALSSFYEGLGSLSRNNTQVLLQVPEFQTLLKKEATGYSLLTYKPVALPNELAEFTILGNSRSVTNNFENKAWFRENNPEFPFPRFVIYDRTKLKPTLSCYRALTKLNRHLVLQDEQLSGGKGTHIAKSFEQFKTALVEIERMSENSKIVVSELLENAKERTIQACVTKTGVYTGPIQRQVIADSQLSNTSVFDGDRFCGIEVLPASSSRVQKQIELYTRAVGKKLEAYGYKGIFGVDYLIVGDSVYMIEVNPRLTGATPLLTMLHQEGVTIPFYLLHILELSGAPYKITDTPSGLSSNRDIGAMVLMHSHENVLCLIVSTLKSGLYSINNGKLEFFKAATSFGLADRKAGRVLIQDYMPLHQTVKPGGRLLSIYFPYEIMDKNDQIIEKVREVIREAYSMIELKAVEE